MSLCTAGLRRIDFAPIGRNGLGDPLNAYPHSMAWLNDALFVGTTRSNLCMLRASKIQTNITHWPVECPDDLYDQDMRARVLKWDPKSGTWHTVHVAPLIPGRDERPLPREMGYRQMMIHQGPSDPRPALYIGTYAPARAWGCNILRSLDGETFEVLPRPDHFEDDVNSLRILTSFQGRLYTSPTGRSGGRPNMIGRAVILTCDDPVHGGWEPACEPGFGDPGNIGVFELVVHGDFLYAGTANLKGYQVWRTRGDGPPPHTWERVLTEGAFRGPLNQGAASLCGFGPHLYVGSGIQHGGIDIENKVGPAGPELVRIHQDGTWDLIVGQARDTPDGPKAPLSGYPPGFGNPFNGYFWRMTEHDGWLYLGTFDWSLMLRYSRPDNWPPLLRRIMEREDIDTLMTAQAGADLFRSADGENWLPVTRSGFDNAYNYGIRTFASTPNGLAVGLVNPFAPKVAVKDNGQWRYHPNPNGGAEVWLGRREGRDGSGREALVS